MHILLSLQNYYSQLSPVVYKGYISFHMQLLFLLKLDYLFTCLVSCTPIINLLSYSECKSTLNMYFKRFCFHLDSLLGISLYWSILNSLQYALVFSDTFANTSKILFPYLLGNFSSTLNSTPFLITSPILVECIFQYVLEKKWMRSKYIKTLHY